jgi:hypothetical protein
MIYHHINIYCQLIMMIYHNNAMFMTAAGWVGGGLGWLVPHSPHDRLCGQGNGIVKFVRPFATVMRVACRSMWLLPRVVSALHGACAFYWLARVRPPQERM